MRGPGKHQNPLRWFSDLKEKLRTKQGYQGTHRDRHQRAARAKGKGSFRVSHTEEDSQPSRQVWGTQVLPGPSSAAERSGEGLGSLCLPAFGSPAFASPGLKPSGAS